MKTNIEKIKHLFFIAVNGEAWHGPALNEIINKIDENFAGKRLPGFSHNIAEIMFHIIAWTEEVIDRLKGKMPSLPERGDWQEIITISSADWSQLKKELLISNEKLISVLDNFSDAKLADKVGDARDAPLGTGISYEEMLYGLLQHHSYHGGQISLIFNAINNGKNYI
jgi:uncharacterized damage-inducible protein DinB